MNSCELVTLISTIACAIAKTCSIDEINLLSAFFVQLGDSLATISVSQSICETNSNTTPLSSSTSN